jgi:hypothetical protein
MAEIGKLYPRHREAVRVLMGVERLEDQGFWITSKAAICDCCGAVMSQDDLNPIADWRERIAGHAEIVPVGECVAPSDDGPECRCLAHAFDDLLMREIDDIVGDFAAKAADPARTSIRGLRKQAGKAIYRAITRTEKQIRDAEALIARRRYWPEPKTEVAA